MPTTPTISCIICSYNRDNYIVDAIESVVNQTLDRDLYEILIIDNNSKDRTAELAKGLVQKHRDTHQIHYFLETDQGLSYARNRGLAEAKGEWLCYIDDDAIAQPDFLESIYNFILKHPKAGGMGGKILPKYVHGKPSWMNPFMEGLVSKVDYGNTVFAFSGKRFPIGCNMTYKKTALEKIGRFDVDLGRKGDTGVASEEKDIFLKVAALGLPVYYLPDAVVAHVIESDRLQYSYIQKISAGIGRGERMRIAKLGAVAVFKKNIELLAKFAAGSIIALGYALSLQFAKAKAVFLFRVNVMRGWLYRG
ncbi:MAG: glycosyltransferase [Schleiferiaceae bacterium]|nr:glycosyltransferase [Schleiferiaceae bacterium]